MLFNQWLVVLLMFTPQKSNIDTTNCHQIAILKGLTFSKPSFWVSMLVFGGVSFAALFLTHRNPFHQGFPCGRPTIHYFFFAEQPKAVFPSR